MNRRLKTLLLLKGAAIGALSGGAAAYGQDASDNQEPADIVVTALKRDTRLQDTPLAITAITALDLEKMGASSALDIARVVPGLNFTNTGNPGNNRITIRGVQGFGESTAGFYLGETPLTGPSGAGGDPGGMTPDINLYDVGSIEVLRGPQGTLYGSGSMTGTIKLGYNHADSARLDADVRLSATSIEGGGTGHFARGMVNVPLIDDRLAIRLVGYDEVRPGYVDNITRHTDDINRMRVTGGRAMVDFKPTDTLSVHVMAMLQRQRVQDSSYWYPANGTYKVDSLVQNRFPSDFELYTAKVDWELPFAVLTATSSYWNWELSRTRDIQRVMPFFIAQAAQCSRFFDIATPCTPQQKLELGNYINSFTPVVNYQPLVADAWIHEARLTSNSEGPLTWTLGVYWEDREDSAVSAVGQADPGTGNPMVAFVPESSRSIAGTLNQKAIYGEATYEPLDGLNLTAGARYYSYKKETFTQVTQSSFINFLVAGPPFTFKAKNKGWVTKINASYDVARDIMIYAQRSEGFRPGGVNNTPGLPPEYLAYEPDSLVNYEAGLKSAWFDGQATLNMAAYQINWNDMQIIGLIPGFGFVTNVGKAVIKGLEIEGTARVGEGLMLRGNLNLNHGELKADQIAGFVQAPGRKGDRIPYEPEVTGGFAAEYAAPISDDITGSVRADYSYTGTSFSQYRPDDFFYEKMGGFSQVNMRWGIDGSDWGVSAQIQNLFDTVGKVRVDSSLLTIKQTISTQPRTFSLELRKSF